MSIIHESSDESVCLNSENNENNNNHPFYRSTCVSQHLQLRPGGFCWCKVLLFDGNQHIRIRRKTLEFSSTGLSTLYVQVFLNSEKQQKSAIETVYLQTKNDITLNLTKNGWVTITCRRHQFSINLYISHFMGIISVSKVIKNKLKTLQSKQYLQTIIQ